MTAQRVVVALGALTVVLVALLARVGRESSELEWAVRAEPGPVLASAADLGLEESEGTLGTDWLEDLDEAGRAAPGTVEALTAIGDLLRDLNASLAEDGGDDVDVAEEGAGAAEPANGKVRFVGEDWKRFLFVTAHGSKGGGDDDNVLIYDYNLSAKHLHHWKLHGLALRKSEVKKLGLQNLRGMKAVGDALFVASAHSSRSKIIVTNKCSFKPRAAKTFSVDGLDHPYGIAYWKGHLFTASQNTGKVVRYKVTDKVGAKAHTFAHVKHPRGLAFDRLGRLWVCSTSKGVYVLDGETGEEIDRVKIEHPVGIALHFASNTMYIGSYDGKKSAIYGVDTGTLKVRQELHVSSAYELRHPAGIAISGGRLFAVGQESRNLYAWAVPSGQFKGAVLTDLPKRPEQVAVLRCQVKTNKDH